MALPQGVSGKLGRKIRARRAAMALQKQKEEAGDLIQKLEAKLELQEQGEEENGQSKRKMDEEVGEEGSKPQTGKKSRKERRLEKKEKENQETTAVKNDEEAEVKTRKQKKRKKNKGEVSGDTSSAGSKGSGVGQLKSKHVAFVGNIPFDSCSTEKLTAAFPPNLRETIVNVRFLTEKGTNKLKGCAFVDFSSGASLHKALLLGAAGSVKYQKKCSKENQTEKLEAEEPEEREEAMALEIQGRRLRIEPTAGGGGNSEKRREKIQKRKEICSRKAEKFQKKIMQKDGKPSSGA